MRNLCHHVRPKNSGIRPVYCYQDDFTSMVNDIQRKTRFIKGRQDIFLAAQGSKQFTATLDGPPFGFICQVITCFPYSPIQVTQIKEPFGSFCNKGSKSTARGDKLLRLRGLRGDHSYQTMIVGMQTQIIGITMEMIAIRLIRGIEGRIRCRV